MAKQTWQQWARACAKDPSSPSKIGKPGYGNLAALTGQDTRALNAIVACYELYANSDECGQRVALEAVRSLVPAMQYSTRWLAQELIPFVLDWDDRKKVWPIVVYTHLEGSSTYATFDDDGVGLGNLLERSHP